MAIINLTKKHGGINWRVVIKCRGYYANFDLKGVM